MKYINFLSTVIIVGLATTSFAGRGNSPGKSLNVDKIKTEAVRRTENAEKDFSAALVSAKRILKSTVNADVKFSMASGKASNLSKSLEGLGKVLGTEAGRVALLKSKIESTLEEVSKSLEKSIAEIKKAEATKTVLSPKALELAQVNEAILKLIGEAVKTGEEKSFNTIVKMQEVLRNVDLKDVKNVAQATAQLLKIAKVDKLAEIIKCKI